jgi:uncharacterized RDD family membrane protein YckC
MKDAPPEPTSSELHQVVHSPEQYRLELPLAGPSSRILAYSIDYVLILILSLLLMIAVFVLFPLAVLFDGMFAEFREAALSDDPNAVLESNFFLIVMGFVVVIQLAVEWIYFIFFEMTMNGRSPGKAVVKLRVLGDGGHPLGFGQSVARNLLRTVDILPLYYIVGLISMVISPEAKRLGDLAAGTIVIRLDRPAKAAPIEPEFDGNTNIFRFNHEQIARVGPEELRLIRQTLRRLPELGEDHAAHVLERTVTVLAERLDHETIAPAERKTFLHALLQAVEMR